MKRALLAAVAALTLTACSPYVDPAEERCATLKPLVEKYGPEDFVPASDSLEDISEAARRQGYHEEAVRLRGDCSKYDAQ